MQDDTKSGTTRREALGRLGAAALAAGLGPLAAGTASAQARTVRVWTTQGAPLQLQAYDYMIKGFEVANPDLKISLELFSDNDAWAKLTAAYAGGDLPDLVQHLTPETTGSLYIRGLVEMMTDVVKEVGEADFLPNNRAVYRLEDGSYFGMVVGNAILTNLWYRKDLLAEQGLKPPQYLEDWLEVAKKTTRGGMYGAALPYAKRGMANSLLHHTLLSAGGWVISPDMQVVFNSPATIWTLNFLKEMRQYCPPGANNYSFGETMSAFVAGAAATSIYTGRVLIEVETKNPKIGPQVDCGAFPYRREGGKPDIVMGNSFASQFIPKGAKNVAGAKKFAAWQYKPDVYVRFLHATPGHLMPALASTVNSPAYLDNAIFRKYPKTIEQLAKNAAVSRSSVLPSPNHKFIYKFGEIIGSNVLAEVLQRVVVDNQTPQAAAAWGQDRIAQIMKS